MPYMLGEKEMLSWLERRPAANRRPDATKGANQGSRKKKTIGNLGLLRSAAACFIREFAKTSRRCEVWHRNCVFDVKLTPTATSGFREIRTSLAFHYGGITAIPNVSYHSADRFGGCATVSEMRMLLPTRCILRWICVVGLLAILAAPGCSQGDRRSQSGGALNPLGMLKKNERMTREELQRRMMRFTDGYLATMQYAVSKFEGEETPIAVRVEAHRVKLYPALVLVSLAADESPDSALLDMIVIVSLLRRGYEGGWADEMFGAQGEQIIQSWRELDDSIWSLAQDVLTDDQLRELKEAITAWREANKDQRNVYAVRFEDFSGLDVRIQGPDPFSQGLLLLNPLSDTSQAVQDTRAFGDRAIYVAERMPVIFKWYLELSILQMSAQPETQRLLARVDELSGTAQRYAEVLESLPETIRKEREAAFAAIDERKDDLNDTLREAQQALSLLNEGADRGKALAEEARVTLKTADDTLRVVSDTVVVVDKFLERFDSKEDDVAASAPAEPSRPFDINEYRAAAGELSNTLDRVNEGLRSLQGLLDTPNFAARLDEIDALAARRVDHVYRWTIALVIAIGAAILIVAIGLRIIGRAGAARKAT